MYNDHAPILAVPNSQRTRSRKPFRFENWWLMENEYKDIAKQSWQRSTNRDFSQKISCCRSQEIEEKET
jgi:hypothetical protein